MFFRKKPEVTDEEIERYRRTYVDDNGFPRLIKTREVPAKYCVCKTGLDLITVTFTSYGVWRELWYQCPSCGKVVKYE